MRERESVVVARAAHDRHVSARAHACDSYKNAMRAKNLTKVRGICHDALEADRDGTYLYEKLVTAAKQELGKNLYDPDYYWLQYQMPDAPFTINVDVDDPTAVLRAYKEFATLENQPELKKRIIRRIIPRALLKEYGNAPVFGKRLSRDPARCAHSPVKCECPLAPNRLQTNARPKRLKRC